MKLHDRLYVTPAFYRELKTWPAKKVRKWIREHELFGGYPKEYREAQENAIYGRIKHRGESKEAKKG